MISVLQVCLLSCDTAGNLPKSGDQFFVKYYGEDGDQTAVDMIANLDGSVVILANSNVGDKRILLVKVGQGGEIVWQKKIGTITDVAKDIEQLNDKSGYVILSQYQETVSNVDIKLTTVSNDGVEMNSITHGSPANDFPNAITNLKDGGFIIAGYSEFTGWTPSSTIEKSILHYRCDNSFQFMTTDWAEYFGSGTINVATKVIEKGDSLSVFGYTNAISGQNPNSKLVEFYYGLDDSGPKGSVNYLGDINNDVQSVGVTQTSGFFNDGFLIIGTNNPVTDSPRLRVGKLRNPLTYKNNKDVQFERTVDNGSLLNRNISGVTGVQSFTHPDGYLIASNETDLTGQTNIILSKIDQSGNEMWSCSYGSSKNDLASSVIELPDGKILVLGTIQLDIQLKIALLKVNSRGQFTN